MEEDVIVTKTIVLMPLVKNMVIDFPPIRYNLAKWDIRPSAALILDEMAKVMLDNPELIVELGSHTDSRSSAEYNKDLSQKRAQSAVDYLISKGVNKDHLTAKGYGEDEPLVLETEQFGVSSGTELTEELILKIEDEKRREDVFELNRRTEFKIVGSK
jgi:outer membrane protein OmpA-like peptidoglycan-associated protein